MRLNQGLLSGVNIGDRFILSESDFTRNEPNLVDSIGKFSDS